MSSQSKNILIFLLVVLVLVMGYMVMTKNKQDSNLPETIIIEETASKSPSTNWKAVSPDELADVLSLEPDLFYVKESGLKLSESVDLTGDGVDEGVFTGDGGNNNVSFILTTNSHGTIVTTKQQEKDGSFAPVSLYEIGRAQVYQNFKILPTEQGFYKVTMDFDESANNTETSHFKCTSDSVNGYVWNSQTKMFVWNREMSAKYTKELCK
ncbi:MAG: hypothetical protein M3Q34_01740 [bacterium]|nr:hypothetical protein [bacterium]